MNENLSVERLLAAYMADEAVRPAPERLFDDVFSATSRLQPDARWLALLKERPLHTESRVVVGTSARRLVLAAAAVALLIVALAAAIAGAILLQPPEPAADDWPMFRGDATRAGLVLHGPIGRPLVTWRYRAQGAVNQNLSIVGDTVYVPTDSGFVDAVRRSDGTVRWSAQLDSAPASGLIVTDGLVLVRDGDGVAHGFDTASGVERWHSTGRSPGGSNAALGEGAIYVGSDSGDLVAFDAKTGNERWRAPLGAGGAVKNSAYADGLVYVATDRAGFLAVDARSGTVIWRFDPRGQGIGTPVVADGIAYIGAGGDTTTGHLWALDSKTGEVRWQTDEPIGSPSLADGIGYANEPALGAVVALDVTTGVVRWRVKFAGGGPTRAPAIADGIVYVPEDGEHRIYALDAATGGELWHFDLDSGDGCCVAVAKGAVFAGTDLGTVYDIGGDGARLVPAPIVVPTSVPSSASQPSAAAATIQAKFVWKAPDPGDTFIPSPGMTFDANGRIWVTDAQNDRFAIFTTDGRFDEYWGKSGTGDGEFNLRRSNGDGYGGVAFEPDGSFFVLDVGNRRVQKFDAKRQLVTTWGGFGIGPGQYSDPLGIAVGPDGTVYVLDDVRGVVEKYDATGKVLGTVNVFSNTQPGFNASNAFAVDADGDLFVSQISPRQVAKFDSGGHLLATLGAEGPGSFQDQPGSIAFDDQGDVFVTQGPQRGSAPGVLVFAADGTYIGGFGSNDFADEQVAFPGGILADADGNVYVKDAGFPEEGHPGSLKKFTLSSLRP